MSAPGGLREAHAHIAQHGQSMDMLRLDDCADADDCLRRVAAEAERLERDGIAGWILGTGLRVQAWSDPSWPDVARLDAATGARPCCLWSFDHHALLANSGAMREAGVTPGTSDPPNGRIVRERGGLTGLMLEAAARLVWAAAPEPDGPARVRLVRAALADFARHGFTEVHELLAPAWLGPVLAELDAAGDLPVSVTLYVPLGALSDVARTAHQWERPRVRLGGGKIFADGTLNARTAWMLAPYTDPLPGMPTGQPMMTGAELRDAIVRTGKLGLGLAVHAIGDAAVRAALDAWEECRPSGTAARSAGSPSRFRIEHAELIDADDVPRFARLGVICSVQPCHLLADVEALRRGLPHRLDRVFPLRQLIDSGCTPGEWLWFGSDAPIVRPDPGDSIQAAVHRRRAGAGEVEAIAPGQAIREREAWDAFAPGTR